MAQQPEALKRAHMKPGTKFYHGGHGTSHFTPEHDLHLHESVVDRLVTDGLLDAEPPEETEKGAEAQPEQAALPAPAAEEAVHTAEEQHA